MRRLFLFMTTISFLASCRNTQIGQLPEIVVDIDQTVTLPLSLITEEMTIIKLELTDESITSPERIKQILFFENYVIVVESHNILVFNKEGKFFHTIGSRGQGPGDYNTIRNVTIDEKDGNLYVLDSESKILCFNLNGTLLKRTNQMQQNGFSIYDLKIINDNLMLVVEQWRKDEKGGYKHSAIYIQNKDFQITDSCLIRDVGFEKNSILYHSYENYLFYDNLTIYLYYPDLYSVDANPEQTVLRDTLYRFENNQLIPELKLKFKNVGINTNGNKFIYLFNIYQSSRYVFAVYARNDNTYRYCFDTETKKGYNVLNDEFVDDINQIGELIRIRPLTMNTEMFYYLYTNMEPDELEEPNPTLYIGKLKNM